MPLSVYFQYATEDPVCILQAASLGVHGSSKPFVEPAAFIMSWVMALLETETEGSLFRLGATGLETIGAKLSPLEPWERRSNGGGRHQEKELNRFLFRLPEEANYRFPYYKDVKADSTSVLSSVRNRIDFSDETKIAMALRSYGRCMITGQKGVRYCHIVPAVYEAIVPPERNGYTTSDPENGIILAASLHSLHCYGDLIMIPLPAPYFTRDGVPTEALQPLDEYPTAFALLRSRQSMIYHPNLPAIIDVLSNPPFNLFHYDSDHIADNRLPPRWSFNYKFGTSLIVKYGDGNDASGFEKYVRAVYSEEEERYDERSSQASTRGSASEEGDSRRECDDEEEEDEEDESQDSDDDDEWNDTTPPKVASINPQDKRSSENESGRTSHVSAKKGSVNRLTEWIKLTENSRPHADLPETF